MSESLGLFLLGNLFFATLIISQKNGRNKVNSSSSKPSSPKLPVDGTYCQHSTNYHRMMLHLALIYSASQKSKGNTLPKPVIQRLQNATHLVG